MLIHNTGALGSTEFYSFVSEIPKNLSPLPIPGQNSKLSKVCGRLVDNLCEAEDMHSQVKANSVNPAGFTVKLY